MCDNYCLGETEMTIYEVVEKDLIVLFLLVVTVMVNVQFDSDNKVTPVSREADSHISRHGTTLRKTFFFPEHEQLGVTLSCLNAHVRPHRVK